VRPYRGLAILIALGLILEAAFTASVPLAFRLLIDRAIVPRDTALLTTLVVALTIGVVVVAAVGLGRDYLHARVCSLMLRDLRVQIFNQLHRLTPSSAGSDEGSGETAHFSTDLAAIEHAIVSAVAWALLPGLDVIIGTTLLFALEWRLALIAALVFPLAMIEHVSRGPTVIAVTHRRALAAEADRVLVMKDGRLVEDGSHATLMSTKTLYSRLWREAQDG
jgi:ATP-binding cassette subfamily B protein